MRDFGAQMLRYIRDEIIGKMLKLFPFAVGMKKAIVMQHRWCQIFIRKEAPWNAPATPVPAFDFELVETPPVQIGDVFDAPGFPVPPQAFFYSDKLVCCDDDPTVRFGSGRVFDPKLIRDVKALFPGEEGELLSDI